MSPKFHPFWQPAFIDESQVKRMLVGARSGKRPWEETMDEIHWTAWILPCCWDAVSRFPLAFCVFCLAVSGFSQKPPVTKVLFQNVRVFDGKSQTLSPPTNVLVMGNKIERRSEERRVG